MTRISSHSKIDNLLLEEEKIHGNTFFMLDITMISWVKYKDISLSKEIGFNTINVLIGNEIGSSISKSTGVIE